MNSPLNRRRFIQSAGLTLAAWSALPRTSSAIDPFVRPGPARLPLSVAAYSFRQYFKDSTHDRQDAAPENKRIDLYGFIDFCATQPCQGVELTSYYFPKDVDKAYLLRLRRHAFIRGIDISGTAVGNTFTHPPGRKREEEIGLVKKWIDHAQVLGAPHIRVFAGAAPSGTSPELATQRCIQALEECCDYAGQAGVFLGIENHGGIVAESKTLLEIIQAVNSPWLGINLDTGNFHTDDPYADLAACLPYAINVQLKVEMRPRGQATQEADLPRLVQMMRDHHYQGYVVLEYEAAPDPWQAVPVQLKRLHDLLS